VVLRTEMAEVLGLQQSTRAQAVDKLSSVETGHGRGADHAGLPDGGPSLGALRLRRRYGVYPLAVHRRNQNIGRQLDDLVVRVGDTLLLEGAPEDIQRLAATWSWSMSPSPPSAPTAAATRPSPSPRWRAS
jgi:K+/H+ antiporter YhaU regulatory subunit KhtT